MASKFSLLTSLTLNASGFNTGLESAKKSTQSFAQGTEKATSLIANSYSKLGGELSNVAAPIAGLTSVVTNSIASFRLMIPAITGVKLALIASGIGAIVVALGIAFAALTSYLTGTSEGAGKLREAFGYISGAVTALMNRLKYLGAAIFSLFSGDWEGMKKNFAEAFSSGFFDEVVAASKEGNELAKQRNALLEANNAYNLEEIKLKQRYLELETQAKDKTEDANSTAQERLDIYNQMLAVDNEMDTKKKKLLDWELQIAAATLKAKGNNASQADKEAYYAVAKKVGDWEAANFTETQSQNKQKQKLERDLAREKGYLNSEASALILKQNKEFLDKQKQLVKSNVEVAKPTLKAPMIGNIGLANIKDPMQQELAMVDEKYKNMLIKDENYYKERQAIIDRYAEERKAKEQNTIDSIGMGLEVLGNIFSIQKNRELAAAGNNAKKREEIEKRFANKQKAINIAQAVMNGALGITKALSLPTPFNWIEAALIGAMTATQVGVIASQKFAMGGIVGGASYSGDKVSAMVNSGEMILNSRQQNQLFDIANGKNSFGNDGEIKLRVAGSDLVAVLSNTNRRAINFR